MKKIIKGLSILFLIIPFVVLNACGPPWAFKIAEMKTTWKSDTPSLQFTVTENDNMGGFGYAIDSNDERKDIYLFWSASTVKFLIYLIVDNETDLEKIFMEENIILYGKYAYHNKKNKQVKLTIINDRYADKLFNGLYTTIILSSTQ